MEEVWVKDVCEFISHWEHEVDSLRQQQVDVRQCREIVDVFQREKDLLLCRKPVSVSDQSVMTRLTPLSSKLDTSLAMALCSTRKK
jgi:hypothetical protein